MEPTTPAPASAPTEGPLVNTPYHVPAHIGGQFDLIYLGDSPASYLVNGAHDGTAELHLSVGEEKTIDGYRLRLVTIGVRGTDLAVTDPTGKRIGY
jgi:hypothetical protein